jgi:enoyl-[acyl-carrier protein] reductase II
MKPELLKEHINKTKAETSNPFGVNIPLIRGDVEKLIDTVIESNVTIVFTSAGSPLKFTKRLIEHSIIVVHVVSNVIQAKKCEDAGCNAIVAEGFEAGVHNGIDEITTMCLIPQVVDAVNIPVIAAGGIADGRAMGAAFMLGAEGVQVGTRFAATVESSSHINFKNAILNCDDTSTVLALKKVIPVRFIKNEFVNKILIAESNGATKEELISLLENKREMRGIFEGDLNEGELEAGQISGLIKSVITAEEVVISMISELNNTFNKFQK